MIEQRAARLGIRHELKTRLNAASPLRGPRGTVISQFAGDAHPVYYFSTSDQTPFQLVHGAVVRN
jgi:hypothetical protein